MSQPAPEQARLTDYREHYRVDAASIVDPDALDPVRRASESRRLEALVRSLALRPGERLLDVGCGSGWLAERCRQRGARVWAMDLALDGVRAARQRFAPVLASGAFLVGDAYQLPLSDASVDVAVLSEVAEHLEDPGRALREVRRVLRRNGRLLVSVPYRERIVQHLCIHCNRLTPANAHLHSFDDARLAELLAGAGLVVVSRLHLGNRLLELGGCPRWSASWPYWCWRAVDRLASCLVPRPGFLAAVAVPAA